MGKQTRKPHASVNHETRKAMIQLQLRPENSKEPYPATQKSLARKLHYWSASSYERLRQSGMQLPHTRTVKKWIAAYFYAHNYVKGENIKILLLQLPIT